MGEGLTRDAERNWAKLETVRTGRLWETGGGSWSLEEEYARPGGQFQQGPQNPHVEGTLRRQLGHSRGTQSREYPNARSGRDM